MINLTANRKEELTRYIELLINLKANGVNCDGKIEEALEELHNIMIDKVAKSLGFEIAKSGIEIGNALKQVGIRVQDNVNKGAIKNGYIKATPINTDGQEPFNPFEAYFD